MKSFEVTREIQAEPDAVWAILTDTSQWPSWDPFCDKVEGQVALGNKIKAFTKLAPGRGFAVKVTELVAPQKMTWSGGMPFGLFKGVRTYTLEPLAGGATQFSMREEFSGPMLRLIGGSLPDMTEAFEAFAKGLQERAEAGG
jgi:hypothetical protein